jgi:hypothetical protein
MSPEQIFSIVNAVALLSWVLLAVLPGRKWVTRAVTGTAVPALLAALYTAIMVVYFGRAEGGFSTLEGVRALFSNTWLVLAGWVHYLAFDLLIGTWVVDDSRERGIPHLLIVPCLALTFLFGPAGWLLYRALREIHARR